VVVDNELLPDVVGGVLQEVREHNLPHWPHLQSNTGQVFTGFIFLNFFLGSGWGERWRLSVYEHCDFC